MPTRIAAARAALAPTGTLRAAINIGNPVLAHGPREDPGGVTVDIAHEIASRLGVPLDLQVFTAAKDSFAAVAAGESALGFLAVEPARAERVAFTGPYALIEGVFVVAECGGPTSVERIDAPGVRIGVKEGSAYDLFLTRTLRHARLVRGAEGVDVYLEQGLEAGAGIRQPVLAFAASHPGHRVIDEAFMQIRQAVALPAAAPTAVVEWADDLLDGLKSSGFIAASLARSGNGDVAVAPPSRG